MMRRPPISLDVEALERLDIPVLTIDPGGVIRFANQAARSMMEQALDGIQLATLFPDPLKWREVELELLRRMRGEASAYESEVMRASDGARIPVSIFAAPQVDADGQFAGSVAWVSDLRERRARQAMHVAIETLGSGHAILQAVSEELAKVVEFDSFRVTAMSERREHMRRLFPRRAQEVALPNLRWWRIRPHMREMLDDERPKHICIAELFSRPDYRELAMEDGPTSAYLLLGYKHVLSIPIKQNQRIVAYVALETKSDQPFSADSMQRCMRLPLAEAVLMALRYEEVGRLRLATELVRELSCASDDLVRTAHILVEKLAKHFEWEHVSMFQLDDDTDRFRVLSQAGKEVLRLPNEYYVRRNEGLVGMAFAAPDGIVNAGNINAPPYAASYRQGVPGILSELCVRVPGPQSRWVLNIEAKEENAFAEEEVGTVELLTREAGLVLERAALLEMRQAILQSVNDAIIETDRLGVIRYMNNAAHALIGRCTDDLIHTCLADLIDDAATAAVIRRADSLSRRETILVRSGGEHVPVAIRGTLMPSHLGGKVFVLNDLTFQRELQRLDLIKEVFRQAALETRVPLSLAASYLERLDKSEVGRADLVDKALKQLRKVDIPLERLLRLASEHAGARDESERAGMEKVLNSVLQEMTDSDRQQICVDGDALDAHVAVERNTLAFCMETMLSFALRTRPLDGAVRIDLRKTAPNGNSPARACFSVTGDWRPQVEAQETADISNRWRRKAIVDLTLGSTILQDIARRAGGTFTSSMNRKSTLNLELDLPLAKTGRD